MSLSLPEQTSVREAADGIFQITIPLPFALDHVHCYMLQGATGWTIIDAGLNTSIARATWERALEEMGVADHQIEQIILTHMHPDHVGLTGWLQQKALAAGRTIPVRMSPITHEHVKKIWMSDALRVENFVNYFVSCGLDAAFAREVIDETERTARRTKPSPTLIEEIVPGSTMTIGTRQFELIHAPGHADGQLLFYDRSDRLILSADHVLMKITPNIGRWTHGLENPLGAYLASLEELQSLDVRVGLPGHRALIQDWTGRLNELRQHHDERLEHVLANIVPGASTYDVARAIFKFERFSLHEVRFAVAEALAHIIVLEERGEVRRDVVDDVWRFTRC